MLLSLSVWPGHCRASMQSLREEEQNTASDNSAEHLRHQRDGDFWHEETDRWTNATSKLARMLSNLVAWVSLGYSDDIDMKPCLFRTWNGLWRRHLQ